MHELNYNERISMAFDMPVISCIGYAKLLMVKLRLPLVLLCGAMGVCIGRCVCRAQILLITVCV